jgi:protein-S-isoprenylcysteine O-methyltransferase Ste14
MYAAVIVLRVLTVVVPLILGLGLRLYQARTGRRPEPSGPTHHGNRVPTVACQCSVLLGVAVLFVPFTTIPGAGEPALLILAAIGLVLTAAGTAIMLWARLALGAAWSVVPRAGAVPAPVTAGPYALVRHPVYLGFLLGLAGFAVAFANWATLAIFLLGTLPLLIWRAREEERLLTKVYGDGYDLYRQRTKMIVPYLI